MLVVKDTAGKIYPADLCTWVQTDVDGGYTISTVEFYGTGSAVAVTGADLGFIGKSGRFVKLSK